MKELLLGIDIGTSGCKVTAIDLEGHVVDSAFAEFVTARPHSGWCEQEPDDWFRVSCELLREIFGRGSCRPEQVVAVSLDGSTHNAALVDRDFRPIRPAIMWTDQRSVRQAASLEKEAGDLIFKTAYQRPTPTWTLPQLLWVRDNEPGAIERTAHVLFTKDYVRHCLTGTWETDHIEAQGSLLYDMAGRCWSQELCALGGLRPEILPPLVEPTTVVGKVAAGAARQTGLPEGTPVIAGCSDSAVEGYAAGAIRPGQMILKMATAGNVNVMTAEPHPHPRTLTYGHVMPGMWYTVVATNTASSAERWFRDAFFARDAELAMGSGRSVYEVMHEMARGVAPGADGLFFHPYLLGERAPYWDANLRGSFVGATMRHGRAHFVRALLEGIVFSLRDCFRTVQEMGLRVDEIRLIGGGAKGDLCAQIASDVFRRPIIRPAGCDASFGAALLAGVGVGAFRNEEEAVIRCTKIRDRFDPQPKAAATYERLFPLYCRIHDDLAGAYGELARVMEGQPS